ncbi:protein of unknown function [Acetoanaerobium sticklandii]|uniref:Uncharacterized protein n=2 Tax=Acetoanaerobium sticklandii TaxID=1511 RepID=E3PUK5_ACESD|nr:protein of unknown function [Acetoanaerobium sticklandii]
MMIMSTDDKLEEAMRRFVEKDDTQTYQKIREYLYEHPNSTVMQVAEATNIPRGKILRYLKEGKLIDNSAPIKEVVEPRAIYSDNPTESRYKPKTNFRRSSRRK